VKEKWRLSGLCSGAWKSTDGASTWTRLTGADTAYSTYNPFGSVVTNLYHVAVLPDDPPNHVLAPIHGAYTPVKVGNTWYSPGLSASDGSIWKTTDEGATWIDLVPGYYWPSPPNPAFMNKNVTGLAATATYLYSNTGSLPELARAPIANDSDWRRNYTTAPPI
jgi:hypothetical protein